MPDDVPYTCALCGGTFDSDWPDALAHAEAVERFGVRGDAPGMVVLCEDCFQRVLFFTWVARHGEEAN